MTSRFYTDKQGRVRYIGPTKKKATSTFLRAPQREKAGSFITNEEGRVVFIGGPGAGGGTSGSGIINFRDNIPLKLYESLGYVPATDEERIKFSNAINALPEEILALARGKPVDTILATQSDNSGSFHQNKWIVINKSDFDNEVVLQHEAIHRMTDGLGSSVSRYQPGTMFYHASKISDPTTRKTEDLGLMLTGFNTDRREWLASIRNIERGRLDDSALNKKIDTVIEFLKGEQIW